LNKDLKRVVEEAWRGQLVDGWMGYILKEKLKGLKGSIKGWSKEVYGGIDEKIKRLVEDIQDLDVRGELMPLSEEEVTVRKRMFEALWHLLKGKESVLMQRSHAKWLREGDYNTKYFHACIKSRGTRNYVNALKVDGNWLETPNEVRQAVVSYFTNHFHAPLMNHPRLDGIDFPVISEQDNIVLTNRFSMEEIEGVVMDCERNKNPGPDGFNFSFIKSFWYLMKSEVNILFQQFYDNELLPKSFSSYFVALIPKVKSPFELIDYRPISLLGCLYKIVVKVLASRLAKVMGSIIAPNIRGE
jgi:hypothetical protein